MVSLRNNAHTEFAFSLTNGRFGKLQLIGCRRGVLLSFLDNRGAVLNTESPALAGIFGCT
jgi:hypothetical protein